MAIVNYIIVYIYIIYILIHVKLPEALTQRFPIRFPSPLIHQGVPFTGDVNGQQKTHHWTIRQSGKSTIQKTTVMARVIPVISTNSHPKKMVLSVF